MMPPSPMGLNMMLSLKGDMAWGPHRGRGQGAASARSDRQAWLGAVLSPGLLLVVSLAPPTIPCTTPISQAPPLTAGEAIWLGDMRRL